eukprot:5746676-Pleurochrysis_carterae.AAC.3
MSSTRYPKFRDTPAARHIVERADVKGEAHRCRADAHDLHPREDRGGAHGAAGLRLPTEPGAAGERGSTPRGADAGGAHGIAAGQTTAETQARQGEVRGGRSLAHTEQAQRQHRRRAPAGARPDA